VSVFVCGVSTYPSLTFICCVVGRKVGLVSSVEKVKIMLLQTLSWGDVNVVVVVVVVRQPCVRSEMWVGVEPIGRGIQVPFTTRGTGHLSVL